MGRIFELFNGHFMGNCSIGLHSLLMLCKHRKDFMQLMISKIYLDLVYSFLRLDFGISL